MGSGKHARQENHAEEQSIVWTAKRTTRAGSADLRRASEHPCCWGGEAMAVRGAEAVFGIKNVLG